MTVELGLPPQPLWLIFPAATKPKFFSVSPMPRRCWTARFESSHWPISAAGRALAARRISSSQPRDGSGPWEKGPLLRDAASGAGFNTNALVLTEELVRTWARAGESTGCSGRPITSASGC